MPIQGTSFASAKALFAYADNQRTAAFSPESPIIKEGGVYLVRGRPVRLELARGSQGDKVRAVLRRTDWHSLTRLQRWRASVLSLFGFDVAQTTSASRKQSRHIAEVVRSVAMESCGRGHAQGRMLAEINDAPLVSRHALEQRLVQSLATHLDQFELRDTVSTLCAAYGCTEPAQRSTVDELAITLLSAIREKLDARLDACAIKRVSVLRNDVVDAVLCQSQWGPAFYQAARNHPDGPEGLVLGKLEEVLYKQAAHIPIELEYELDGTPSPRGNLPCATVSVALGDMHGNCLLMLHSLVKLGYFHIRDTDAWGRLCDQIRSLANVGDADWNCETFRGRLAAALTAGPHLDRPLVLLGGLLGDKVHHDMFMLHILDFMREQAIDYQITFSDHDANLIRYYLDNVGQEVYANRYGAPENARESKMRNDTTKTIATAGEDMATLTRLHTLLNTPQGQTARGDFEQMMQKSYLPMLRLVTANNDMTVLHSHGFAHQRMFSQICSDAGADPLAPVEHQLACIDSWFREKVLSSAKAFERFAQARKGSALAQFAWNIGWQASVCDRPNNEAPRSQGATAPNPRFLAMNHGHTTSVSATVENNIGSPPVARAMKDLMRLAQDGDLPLPWIYGYLERLDEHSPKPFWEIAAMLVMHAMALSPAAAEHPDQDLDPVQRIKALFGEQLAIDDAVASQLIGHMAQARQHLVEKEDRAQGADRVVDWSKTWRGQQLRLAAIRNEATAETLDELRALHGGILADADLPDYLVHRLARWISLNSSGGSRADKTRFSRQALFC